MATMKVACLLGSPRVGGNTEIMARAVIAPLEAAKHEVKVFALNKLKYRGCQGCYACKGKHDHCVLKDDLTEVLDYAATADVWLLATPVYYGDVTGQMKCFIDRTFSYLADDYTTSDTPLRIPAGKRAVFLTAQGSPNAEDFKDLVPRYKNFLDWYGFHDVLSLRAVGADVKEKVDGRQDLMLQAAELGKRLVKRT